MHFFIWKFFELRFEKFRTSAHYIGMEHGKIQNQKWIWASFYLSIKIYVNNDAHNFEMRQPKGFFDFTKVALTCKFCLFCFASLGQRCQEDEQPACVWRVSRNPSAKNSTDVSELIYFIHFFRHSWGCLISKLCALLLTYILIYR